MDSIQKMYPKATGSAGSKGVDFQLDLLSMFLLNSLRNNIKNWKLSTENKLAAKFDDIVLELSNGSAIMVQAKHKGKKKVNLNQLLSTNSRNDDFSLPKYFFSYLDIKTKFSIKSLVICTNTHIDAKVLPFLTQNAVDSESMLYCEDCRMYYTFNDNLVPDLLVNARDYHKYNLEGNDVDEAMITEENAIDFLKHLDFYVNYPSGKNLEATAEKLLSGMNPTHNLFRDVSYRDLHRKIKNWFECPKGEYLTEHLARAMFCEIKSDKYLDFLNQYRVSFRNLDFINTESRILHVVADKAHLLHLLRIYQACKSSEMKVLYAGCEYGRHVQQETIEVFALPKYTCLIIDLPAFLESEINEIFDTVLDALDNRDYKQVIFVTRHNELLTKGMISSNIDYNVLEDSLTLEDLSEVTQEMLKAKNIIFQGEHVRLEELLPKYVTESNKATMDSQLLEMLIRGENLKVGLKFGYQEVCEYYIERKFERKVKKMWNKNERLLERKEILSEDEICAVEDKIILISDMPGMGKTTALKTLAAKIKKSNQRLWVLRIELNQCTNILKNCLLNNRSIDTWDLLNCKDSILSANALEKFVFEATGAVVLMLDGVDEISPDYTELILSFLLESQKADNLLKVFVTTRSHMATEFETELKTTCFNLGPLSEEDQIHFFSRYWTYNLKLEGDKISRCKQYAKSLISKVSSWIREWYSDVKFVALPLHSRMVAEIFLEKKDSGEWQGCKEFLTTCETEPKLPDKINIFRLYQMFMEKKRAIFMAKGNPSGNTMAHKALMDQFEECLAYHRSLALKLIFDEEECTFFSCYKQNTSNGDDKNVLKMGIVQNLNNQIIFVHRTFAEYFVAESILKELQLQNPDARFQQFLIDTVFVNKKFTIIRKYIDNFLYDLPPLPSGIFKSYMLLDNDTNNSNIIHLLALESNNEIIRFLLNYMDFKVTKTKKRSLINYIRFFQKNNTLSTLKHQTKYHGIDVKHYGWTPLHYAVLGGHIDTVKLLLDMGADINCGSENKGVVLTEKWTTYSRVFRYHEEYGVDLNSVMWDGHTPLHLAVGCCWFNIVQLLVERGADVNVETDEGITALHYASWCGWLEVVAYLVQHGTDVNVVDSEGNSVVHFAAKGGNLTILEFLSDYGVDLHAADRFGNTALHFSAEKRSFDVVKFLLKHDVDINIADQGGHTALHFAIESDSLDMVVLIAEHGADVNIPKNIEGYSVLELAILKGNSEIIDFLCTHGVNLNVADKNGDTALHLAVRSGKSEIVELLVKHNADVNVVNHKGLTPLDCAWKMENFEIVRSLLENNAQVNIRRSGGRNFRLRWTSMKATWSNQW